MMRNPPYFPPPEAFAFLPLGYFDLSPEQRACALQIAGREMADDVFERFFTAIAAEITIHS